MSPITRPVMRYHGGKFGSRGSVADRIIRSFPPHRVYVEPYGGGASVLMRKPRSYAEIYNDRAGYVVAVFRVLRDPLKAARLQELLRLTPFARDEMVLTGEAMLEGLDDIELARRVIFRSFAGFGSAASNPRYNTGFRSNSNRSHTTPALDWSNYPGTIPFFTERLQGVVIENREALEIIEQHDGPDTLHYVDPPYVHSSRSQKRRREREYQHELTDADHDALAERLHRLSGMIVLSGYHSPLYDRLYSEWEQVEFRALADGAQPRREVLWFNPLASTRRRLVLEAAS